MRLFHTHLSPIDNPQLASKQDVLEATLQKIRALEARKYSLLREAGEVDVEIQLARATYGRLSNENAHIAILPSELLTSIFMICRDQHLYRQKSFEVTASHVSHHWRSLATGTPLLWSNIHVNLSLASRDSGALLEKKLERLKTYLTRSQTCLFNAKLEINGNHDIQRFLQPICDHISHCRRLSISIAHHGTPDREVRACLEALTAPQLQSLSIRIAFSPYYPHDRGQYAETQPRVLTGGAPALTTVRSSGVAGPLQPPLSNVTTFHIDGSDMDDMTFVQYQNLLEALPCLENLSLHRIRTAAPDQPQDRMNIPSLRSLRLCGSEGFDDAPLLLSALPLDQIQTLTLKEVESIAPLTFPNLKELTVHSCSFPAVEIIKFHDVFPAITTLQCDFSTPHMFTRLAYHAIEMGEAGIPFPQLRTLSVMDMQPADIDRLKITVAKRADLGVPLSRLCLDRRCRSVLRTKNELENLEGAVTVEKSDGVEPWPRGSGYDDDDDGFWD